MRTIELGEISKFKQEAQEGRDFYPVPEHRASAAGNPCFMALMVGRYDRDSPLSLIAEVGVFATIWRFYIGHLEKDLRVPRSKEYHISTHFWYTNWRRRPESIAEDDCVFARALCSQRTDSGSLKYPPFTGINVNMMPFLICRPESLPKNLRPYYDIFARNAEFEDIYDPEHVAYLTVHESFVPKGCSQRRPGLHCDATVVKRWKDGGTDEKDDGKNLAKFVYVDWGKGYSTPLGGLIIGSNISKSTRVWRCNIENPINYLARDAMYGNLEYLRPEFERLGVQSVDNHYEDVWWITDTTPHESLPVGEDCYRQFFRVVLGKIGVWYEKHSTPNPKVQPQAPIIKDDKFTDFW